MANLKKEIRNRITSVSSTMQITSAMKMVSAAKLKKAQDAITALKPYSEKLDELIGVLSSGSAGLKIMNILELMNQIRSSLFQLHLIEGCVVRLIQIL